MDKKNTKIFDTNVFVWIISILLSFSIWFYVMSVENPSYTKTFSGIPIEIDDSYMEYSPYTQYDYRIDLTLQGRKRDINAVTQDDINAYVDTSQIKSSGRFTLDVLINVPDNIEVTEQSLKTITVFFDNRSSTVVPVVAELVSYVLEDGFEIDTSMIELDISTVEVSGPQSILDLIDRAQVNLSLGHVTNSLTVRGTLELIDKKGDKINDANVKLQRTDVIVTIPVYIEKTIPLEVDYKYGYYNENNTRVTISPEFIRIKGEVSVLKDIKSLLLLPIDEKNTADNFNTTITLPNDIINVDNIEQANILIRRINTTDKQLIIDNIIINNPKNFDYDLLDESLIVTIRGDAQYVNYISAKDIQAEIDLSYINNATGKTSVVVNIIISENYSKHIYEVGSYKISVRIN